MVDSRTVRRVVLAAAALLLLAAGPAHAGVPRDWLGVVADGPMTDPRVSVTAEWERLGASGAGNVRASFHWPQAQRTGPDAVDFRMTDHVVLAAAVQGLGVLPVVQGTPAWAGGGPAETLPPRRSADYGRYLRALVGRYGPAGSFWEEHPEVRRRPIRDWQIWNEPNITSYWSRQPFARSYVRLLKAARRALRSADRRARAILAGTPNFSWVAMRQIYRAGGRGAFDAVALHPYTARPANVVKVVRYVRRVMRSHGDGRMPVMLTELSWPATKATDRPARFETNDQGQADRLRRTLRLLARERRRLRIERVYWYTWLSVESEASGPNAFGWSGLRRLRDGVVVSAPSLDVFVRTGRALRRPGACSPGETSTAAG